jgi:DNA-binding transcriptional LysR family regulator
VTPSAISQAVRALETRVGAALFIRTTRSVGLTEAGQRFLSRAKPAFEELVAASEVARDLGQRPAGLLRLSVPRAVVPILLEPLIAFDLSKLILRDGGALAVMRELAELAREIDVHTDLHKLLDEDPVVLVCERDTTVAMSTGFCIATIKPTKRLHRLLTTLRAKKADLESTRSRKLARLDRELDNSAIKTPAAPAARS